jgi:DNA-binding HxlR family transcriptional regulator
MSNHLIQLTQKGWALPVLGALQSGVSGRTHALAKHLCTSPISIKAALEHLGMMGLVEGNAGHGHPLRPECLLTTQGRALGPLAVEALRYGAAQGVLPLLRKRWTLPIAYALKEAASFSVLRQSLRPVTDRALSLSLQELMRARLIKRKVIGAQRPPKTLYVPMPGLIDLNKPLSAMQWP